MLQIPSVRIIRWLVNNDICERYLKIISGMKTGHKEREHYKKQESPLLDSQKIKCHGERNI